MTIKLNAYPPTVNHSHGRTKGGGVYLKAQAREFREVVGWQLRALGVEPVKGEIVLTIHFYKPDQRKRDIDNPLKAVLDALKGHVYHDDDQIVELHVYQYYDKNKRGECWVGWESKEN